MSKYIVTNAKPLLRVRNAENRNQRRLRNRVDNVARHATDTLHTVRVTRPNGTVELYRAEDVAVHTVKRTAEREARKNGARFLVNVVW